MKAAALAAMLMQTPQAEVRAYDPDAEGWYPVTGLTVGGDTIQLYTDSDEDSATIGGRAH